MYLFHHPKMQDAGLQGVLGTFILEKSQPMNRLKTPNKCLAGNGRKTMTANELADFVEISKPNDKTHQAIATMLRQQQAEIEALKVKAHEWYLIAMEKAQEK